MRLYSLKLTALARTVSEPVVPDAGKEAKVPTKLLKSNLILASDSPVYDKV